MVLSYLLKKTYLMLFNNGENPRTLPKLVMDEKPLIYKHSVKFLGVYFTSKLNWKTHIDYLLTKARQTLNFLKIVSSQPWSQDQGTLLHLAISLIRSKLIYGQEVYFSASKTYLNKLQSIDSKAVKLAIGVPVHTNTLKTYQESRLPSLSEQRQHAVSKYVVRSLSVPNSVCEELYVDSDKDFPKRSKNISSLQTIGNFSKKIMDENNIRLENIPTMPVVPLIPRWVQQKANFDINYTDLSKSSDLNELVSVVREHINNKYCNHLKVYTDGSVLESGYAGAGVVIPDMKIQKKYFIGKHFSIFTAELYAILMALHCIIESSLSPFCILFCVDSKSVLQALNNDYSKVRPNIVFEIHQLIHTIILNGIRIDFCWIPSHCGLYWNEVVDIVAKNGASEKNEVIHNLNPSGREIITLLVQSFYKKISSYFSNYQHCPQYLCPLLHKLKLNSWKTKYCRNVRCVCNNLLSVEHVLFECAVMLKLYKDNNLNFDDNVKNVSDFLSNKNQSLIDYLNVIFHSDVYDKL